MPPPLVPAPPSSFTGRDPQPAANTPATTRPGAAMVKSFGTILHTSSELSCCALAGAMLDVERQGDQKRRRAGVATAGAVRCPDDSSTTAHFPSGVRKTRAAPPLRSGGMSSLVR